MPPGYRRLDINVLDGISGVPQNSRPMQAGREAAYAALVATTALWAGNTITGRALADAIPPAAFSFWRWLLVLAILAPLAVGALGREWPVVRRGWRTLALLGLMSTGLYHAWVFWVLHYTTAINAQLLNSTVPLWVMLIGWAAFGTRPTGREWARLRGLGARRGSHPRARRLASARGPRGEHRRPDDARGDDHVVDLHDPAGALGHQGLGSRLRIRHRRLRAGRAPARSTSGSWRPGEARSRSRPRRSAASCTPRYARRCSRPSCSTSGSRASARRARHCSRIWCRCSAHSWASRSSASGSGSIISPGFALILGGIGSRTGCAWGRLRGSG